MCFLLLRSTFRGVCVCVFFLWFLKFLLSPYVAQVLSHWFWNGSSRPDYYQYHFHIPHALKFCYEDSYFKIFSASFLITILSPEFATYINMHCPLLLLLLLLLMLTTESSNVLIRSEFDPTSDVCRVSFLTLRYQPEPTRKPGQGLAAQIMLELLPVQIYARGTKGKV